MTPFGQPPAGATGQRGFDSAQKPMTQLLLPRGPWCCENGERLGMTMCPECVEYSERWQPSKTIQLAGG